MGESVHMPDMVDVGMALDHQVDIAWNKAQLGQLRGGHIVGRDRQNTAKTAQIILDRRGLRGLGVFLRETCVDQHSLICVRLDHKAANADNAAIGVDLKQAVVKHRQTNGFAL